MTQMPSLSVIIPHLNDQAGLELCLTALAQESPTISGLEIIVVDNGSQDPPVDLVAGFENARLMHEAARGPGPARSTGARAAHAQILAFIDSDCEAEPGWAKNIVTWFRDPEAAPILGGDVRIALRNSVPDMVEAYEAVYGYRQRLYIARDKYSATCNLAMRAEIFSAVGDFAGIEIAEDMDWGRRATEKGFDTAYVPGVVIRTPAREDFDALKRKMDRQIGHDFAKLGSSLGARLHWGIKGLALMVSPLAEIITILRSDRIKGVSARVRAFVGLLRARIYRGVRMLGLLLRPDDGTMSGAWNNR